MYEVAIYHLEWIDVDEEVLQIRPMIMMIGPTVGASCDADPWAKNKRRALEERSTGELK
jgi:hypothetical protein